MAGTEKVRLLIRKVVAIAAFTVCCASAAYATEGGGGAYPNGAEDFMAGAVPPPGTYFINYFTYYSADRFNDSKGNSSVPGFKATVSGDVFRILHVTNTKVLGADWAMHVLVPVLNMDVTTPGGSQSWLGFGDITVSPMILAWHSKNFHAAAGLDVFIPLGPYNKGRLANLGRNYWTFEPVVGLTYLSDSGFDVSTKLMYDFNTKNESTKYTSGDEFHMDFAAGKKIDAFTIGASGFYYQQVAGDSTSGHNFGRGSAVAIGPQLKYDYKRASFSLKYLLEVDSRNRPEGNNLWFKMTYAF